MELLKELRRLINPQARVSLVSMLSLSVPPQETPPLETALSELPAPGVNDLDVGKIEEMLATYTARHESAALDKFYKQQGPSSPRRAINPPGPRGGRDEEAGSR